MPDFRPKIKIYSTPACPYCEMAKRYLKEHGFGFEDLNVSEDENALREMLDMTGQMGVPVIEINDKVIIGFNKSEIDKLLGII
jgi:glutaredoxin-like YruB-family protein